VKHLPQLRKKINKLDNDILRLINERTRIALDIGRVKKNSGSEIFVPAREKEVYERILKQNKGPMNQDSLRSIYREIMSAALALEKELIVAYLGPEGTFSQQASISKFGSSVSYQPLPSILEVFHEVEMGKADYGVVPIENSLEGAIGQTLDAFVDTNLKACSEIFFRIRHYLYSKCRNISQIENIYSNEKVFGQCRRWLNEHLPKANLIETSSTARACALAKKEARSAAIAGKQAAKFYKLPILRANIEDQSGNLTRFFVIGKNESEKTGNDKTSILFSAKDTVGALHQTIQPFEKNRINLTKIESRPSRKKAWEYIFFVDLVGHPTDKKVKSALKAVEKKCQFFKVLGAYPRSTVSL